MKTEQLYKITISTDPYHAARNALFTGRATTATLEEGLTLREAQKELLKIYWNLSECYPKNWGLATIAENRNGNSSFDLGSHPDGTRYLHYDVYIYRIEEDNPNDPEGLA